MSMWDEMLDESRREPPPGWGGFWERDEYWDDDDEDRYRDEMKADAFGEFPRCPRG